MARPEPMAALVGLVSLGLAWAFATQHHANALEGEADASAPVVVTPFPQVGSLAGLTVYLSAGHGWVSHERGRGWQRPETYGLVEDTWTAKFVARSLVPALHRAGATVLTARERDLNGASVVVDDTDPRFSATGNTFRETAPRVADQPDTVATGSATSLEPDGRATWSFVAPHTGDWELYASWLAGADRDPRARYTVTTPAGATVVHVDQRARGGTWWPLGSYELRASDRVEVTLTGSGQGTLSANAIRLGGGSMQVTDVRTGASTWHAMWRVSALHQLRGVGVPTWVWATPGGGMGGDASARARWAGWAHQPGEEAVYLSIHTDAGPGRGSTVYVRRGCAKDCTDRDRESIRLADHVRTRFLADVRAQIDPTWVDWGTRASALSELSDELNPNMPAVLVELGHHDDPTDAAALATPAFADTAAAALVAGMVRWRLGPDAPIPPARPIDLTWDGQQVSWEPGDALGWRVRVREVDLWSAPRWTIAPRFSPGSATAVEIAGVGPGGIGTPVVFSLERGDALAEGPTLPEDFWP